MTGARPQRKEKLHRKPTAVQEAQSQGLLGAICPYIRIGEADVNTISLSFLVVTASAWPAWGQKVEVQKPDRGQILHIQTALNHLTVLEMTEPVSTVAVGSPVFKVEWRENRVFIQPTELNAATNLFVWTASGRFNYELDPAGSVPQMDFAIDQSTVDPPKSSPSANRAGEPAAPSPAEVLID